MYASLERWHNVDVTNLEFPEIGRSVLRVTLLSEALVWQADIHAGSHTTYKVWIIINCDVEDTS